MTADNKKFINMLLIVCVIMLVIPKIIMAITYKQDLEKMIKDKKPVPVVIDKTALKSVKVDRKRLLPLTYNDENNVKVQIPSYYTKQINTENGLIVTTEGCALQEKTYNFYALSGKHEGVLVYKNNAEKSDPIICPAFISM